MQVCFDLNVSEILAALTFLGGLLGFVAGIAWKLGNWMGRKDKFEELSESGRLAASSHIDQQGGTTKPANIPLSEKSSTAKVRKKT